MAATAEEGSDVLFLQDSVNWEPGQEIVVVTTDRYDYEDSHQNEVVRIVAVEDKKVQIDRPLRHYHYGGQEYQAEVALLSRRIVLMGHESSEETQYGGKEILKGSQA